MEPTPWMGVLCRRIGHLPRWCDRAGHGMAWDGMGWHGMGARMYCARYTHRTPLLAMGCNLLPIVLAKSGEMFLKMVMRQTYVVGYRMLRLLFRE